MISIQNLNVSYGTMPVLESVSLDMAETETFGLIGLNGAGKTTLIKTILGLRPPVSGNIIYKNAEGEVVDHTAVKNQIAYLPERFEPPSFLKGREFINFSASLYARSLSDEIVDKTAESLELDPKVLKRGVHTYSKGMRQKLGLIATILTGCEFLILDEPMSGLDPQARVCVKDNIIELKKQGRTVFLSSHILADLSEICDRVSVLHNRQIHFTGPPQDLCKTHKVESLERAFLKIIKNNEANAA